jgi:hypothetical protein
VNIQSFKKMRAFLVLGAVLLVVISLVAGCSSNSSSSPAATNTATAGGINGQVVTATTPSVPIPGVTVTANPGGSSTTTDASGSYSLSLPGGSYTLTFTKTNYTTGTSPANVAIGISTPISVTMAEAASGYPTVAVTAGGQNVGYNTSFPVTATATSPNGYAMSYSWSGATAGNPTTTAIGTTVSLATALTGSAASPNDPGTYVSPYVQENRFGILPLNADTRGAKSVSVTANDGHGGKTTASVTVYAAGVQPGVKAVPLGVPVYMNSGSTSTIPDTTSTWTVLGPSSSPTYSVPTSLSAGRNPFFTPDAVGSYVVSKTSAPAASMTIYAGTFAGAISGGTYTTKTFSKTDPKAGMWFDTTNTTYWPSGATSAIYSNWPVVTPDSGCLGCHSANNGPFSNTIAPDEFTPWKDTAHATFFSRGLENITGNSSSCTTCHTAGSDLATSANNGGYDDMVAATGFVYTKGVGKWAAMFASPGTYLPVARVSNIQCENCHGPQTTSADPFTTAGAHGTTLIGTASAPTSTLALRVSYGAEVCAQCHSSTTSHHIYSEWVASINPDTGMGHSKLAQIDATGYSGHAKSTDGSCARCHTAQGFATYVPQLLSGNSGTLPASAITWDKSNAQPQTCQTCHDSHDATNPNQLRVYDKLPITMAGFGVDGFGKGAVCVACHNIRNGIQCASAPTSTGACGNGGALSATGATFLHEDSNTNGRTGVGNASDPDAYLDTMHDASQADVLSGRNFFFMGNSLPMLSKHASVEDTCVGCHMKLNPQTHSSHNVPATSTHVWYIKDADVPTLCANCHSSSVDGVALQAFVEQQLAVLGTKMSTNFVNKINTAIAGATPVYLAKKQISNAASATYFDGSFTITGTLTSGGTTTTLKVSLTTVTTDAAGTLPLITPSDILKKGNWNSLLIERDGSKGIHNPTLIQSVLANTINQAW